ncbi:MAG: acyl-CoA dehydrogenase [Steroidobacteraceae bacterium]
MIEPVMIESNLDPWPVQALEATLELSAGEAIAPAELPPLWHWLYFLPTAPRSALGPDGHMVNQEWVDSTLRRRRLFAAARTEFIRPLRIGRPAQMTERVLGRRDTRGKSGPFQILTVEYQYFQDDKLCVREERDIVYLQGPAPAQPAPNDEFAGPAAAPDSWAMALTPDPVMLMRFSALTFNSHLIHFDPLYTQRAEGYPERVVHAPLVAIILAQLLLLNRVGKIDRFEFRARSPLFVNQPIQFRGKPRDERVELRAIGPSGQLAMQATAWVAGSARGAQSKPP